jgi:predicted flap endonuclease-1-like 5' DNA nuclease
MEKNNSLTPLVKSPAKDAHIRHAKGFSLSEIKESGHNLHLLKRKNIKIDYFRQSSHPENVEMLKKISIEKSKEKRTPFVKKEKKRTAYKPKEEKVIGKKRTKKVTKAPKKKVKKETLGEKPVKPKKAMVKEEQSIAGQTPLTELSGLGPSAEAKLREIGVTCIEELLKESPEEISTLIKGISEDRIMKWIEEGKEVLKQP